MDRITVSDELKAAIENRLRIYDNPTSYDQTDRNLSRANCSGMLMILGMLGYNYRAELVELGKDEYGDSIEEIRYRLTSSSDNIEKDIDKPRVQIDREFDYYTGIIGNDKRKLYASHQFWLYSSDLERRNHKAEMLAKGWEPLLYSKHGDVYTEEYEYMNEMPF